MNIGIVTTWFERGAAYVSRAYRDALQTRHSVFIYARAGELQARGDSNWDDGSVVWAPEPDPRNPSAIQWRHFSKWINDHKLDTIIFNEQQDWQVIVDCSRKLSIPIGAYVDYYTNETVDLFEMYDYLLCNTKRHHGIFSWHRQARYIPWGTDCALFSPRATLVAGDKLTFFHSGGMLGVNLRKGTDLVIQAFAKVHGDCRLVLHAQRLNGLPGEVAALLADPRIEVLEDTVPLPGLYHLGDVYVYPSRLDGLGLSMAEALAAGLPIIASNHAPMNEFVEHGSTGWLVPVARFNRRADAYYWLEGTVGIDALAGQMQWCVDHADEVPLMKARAAAVARQEWNWTDRHADVCRAVEDSVAEGKGEVRRKLLWRTCNYSDAHLHTSRSMVSRRLRDVAESLSQLALHLFPFR